MTPRQCLAAALAGAAVSSVQGQVPAWSLQAQQRLLAGPDTARALAERQRLVQLAETQLAAGATDAAQDAFDQAALVVHSADVEMGLVRTYMQAGDYSRALTFASHAAGAHRNIPAGTALYAWLLHLGGQVWYAQRLLTEALAVAPDDAALMSVQFQVAQDWPRPDAALLQPPLRAAPYATGAVPPASARVVGTAVLAGDGPRGGPVFDAFGRLAGIALPSADGRDRLVPIADVATQLQWPALAPDQAPEPASLDSVYTAALRVAVQLLVAD